MKSTANFRFHFIFVVCIILISCEGFVDIDPPKTQIARESVFSNDAAATSAIAGIYYQMVTTGFASGNESSVAAIAGISADELVNYSTLADRVMFSSNTLLPRNGIVSSQWSSAYRAVYAANTVIEGVDQSSGMSEPVKQQLAGEALFVRAFCHFYLTSLFGDIPIVLSTNYELNASANRSAKAEVLAQVITDLQQAETNLAFNYQGIQRSRPNKSAAQTLLARAYLFTQQWQQAEAKATEIITRPEYELPADLASVFLATSREAIWQLKPSLQGLSTLEGNTFILSAIPRVHSLSPALAAAFPAGDKRRTAWVGNFISGGNTYFFPHKYKEFNAANPVESSMVLRLAEVYLIRAEARAQTGALIAALEDVNRIHTRAGLAPLTAFASKEAALQAIETERRLELFTEWGHRWLDLARTGRSTAILSSLKNPNWQETDVLYPIPQTQIDNNPSITQNAGY